jgi:hypothetical protein
MMMRAWFPCLLGVLLARGGAIAGGPPDATVEVVAAPPIETAPKTGVDPDVSARLDAATRATAGASPAVLGRALDQVLVVFESDDAFSRAQRERVKDRSVAILGTLGTRAREAGELTLAARALDARWTIGGSTRDPELASVLVTWAEREADRAPGEALYLARRARKADPALERAADLDDELSSNPRAVTGKLAILAGAVAFGVGAYLHYRVGEIEEELATHARPGDEVDRMLARRDLYDRAGTGLLIAAPLLGTGGIFYTLSGTPKHRPTSPAELPALEER